MLLASCYILSSTTQLSISILHDGRHTEVKVRHPPVDEVEGLSSGSAQQLTLDALRVRVRSQLLARVLGNQEQCVVLRVGDLEFVGAERAHLLRGGVRVDDQGFGRAA